MARSPILPRSQVDPTGLDVLERKCFEDFTRRMRAIRNGYVKALNGLSYTKFTTNAVNYQYLLDPSILASLFQGTDSLVDSILLDGGPENLWFFNAYVGVAYQRGTAQSFANLSTQSVEYARGAGSLDSILTSRPYLDRVALVRAREFEEMKGLSGKVKADMSRVLADGIGRGLNPLAIAQTLTEQTGMEITRAKLIARTEIPNALRRARWDESDDAMERYQIKSLMMHLSALSATTRVTHAARHAHLYTTAEIRLWYSEGANAIQCKCAQVEVLVDEKGVPLVPEIIERAKRNQEVMRERLENADAS